MVPIRCSSLDRKTLSCFEFKCFLFRNQPNRYPFEAEAKLDGELQIIDVTDDVTGLPHHIAKANIPMYVNEVGHSLDNKQTVFSSASDNGRAVNYNVCLHDGLTLGEGSRIELLGKRAHRLQPTSSHKTDTHFRR